jgi:branched-subunit amino acid ABC-type transport system permease component
VVSLQISSNDAALSAHSRRILAIFGATKFFHVAHGAAFTIAAYLFWWGDAALHLPWP